MIDIIPILIGTVAVLGIFFAFYFVFTRNKGERRKKKKKQLQSKDRNTILKEANRRLSQNSKDPEALLALAELYFNEEAWDKALKTYNILIDLCATNTNIDEFEVTLKHAQCALKLKLYDEAYKSFVIAKSLKQDVFEVNHNLGYLEYMRKSYEKAIALLSQARQAQPEHVPTLRYLGHSLFKAGKFKEALGLLRRVMDLEPEDKESLFALGQCYYELGQGDPAIKIFTHLRPDPILGPNAALFAGTIHMNAKQYPKAIMDFEIGLRHQDIKQDVLVELKYRLAAAYIKQQEIAKALALFDDIMSINPGYKDVTALVRKYRELNSNKNLQIFLMSQTSDFVTLCRKIAVSFFPQAKVKIVDISVQKSEYADILAEVDTKKWEDLVLFRFIRTTGQVGELSLREFHARIKDVKAGRGLCLTAGSFSEEAVKFVEARLIDLIEQEAFTRKLYSVDTTTPT